MLGILNSFKPYVVPKPPAEVPRPDNFIFKLHYKVTFVILLLCSALVSAYHYIDSAGSAIQCMHDEKVGIPTRVINNYCWIMNTFSLPAHYSGEKNVDFIHHGVGPHAMDDERIYHAYYQWVPIVLALQAVFFYAPHWIWKMLENNRLRNIILGMNKALVDDDGRNKQVGQLADYMRQRMKETTEHRAWAAKFFFCECLNFINVIFQMWLTNKFLGGEFTKYGTEVLSFVDMEPEDRVDPMSRIFPKMTKCIFHKYGGSGTIQRFDALCVLGMNILNEKIYIFLWFWFIVLAVLTGCNLVFRVVQYFYPNVRDRMVKLENLGHLDKDIQRSHIDSVVTRLAYPDWLILFYLAKCMDKMNFGCLISNLADDQHQSYYAYHDDDDLEENPTPPPGYEADKTSGKGSEEGGRSARSTLKSSDKISSMLRRSIKKSLP